MSFSFSLRFISFIELLWASPMNLFLPLLVYVTFVSFLNKNLKGHLASNSLSLSMLRKRTENYVSSYLQLCDSSRQVHIYSHTCSCKICQWFRYQAQLQQNLMYLARIADAQPQGTTMPSQVICWIIPEHFIFFTLFFLGQKNIRLQRTCCWIGMSPVLKKYCRCPSSSSSSLH